jgi:hypothetical protein
MMVFILLLVFSRPMVIVLMVIVLMVIVLMVIVLMVIVLGNLGL